MIVSNASSDNVFSKKNSSPFMHNSIKLINFGAFSFSQFLLISIPLRIENMLGGSPENIMVVELEANADAINRCLIVLNGTLTIGAV